MACEQTSIATILPVADVNQSLSGSETAVIAAGPRLDYDSTAKSRNFSWWLIRIQFRLALE